MDVTIVFNQMLVLFLLMLTGYYSLKKSILNQEASKKISSLIVNITNPAFIISGVITDNRIGGIKELITVVFISVGMYIGLIVIAEILPRLLRIEQSNRGLYKAMIVFSNIGFMGFPIISAIFGREVLLYGAVFILPYNILAYTYGINVISNSENKTFNVKNIINPGVIACVIAIFIFILNIKLPSFAINTINSIAGLTTPLSMIVIGISLGTLSFKDLFTDIKLYIFSFIKLIIIPIISFFILKFVSDDNVIIGTTIIMLSTPIGSMTAMLATEYNGNSKLASKAIIVTTIISVITIPLVTLILF